MTAQQAIDRSISHNEIVHLAFDRKIILELMREAEDDERFSNTEREFWGIVDGREWRVHVALR